ncbi:hypothetical protein MASR2M15_07970 [Anaerolineales bacterium]
MGIDYSIALACEPKKALGSEGIMMRIKGQERAETIIRMFRESGDTRPVSEIGFELVRNTAQGEETQIVYVQELLDEVADLDPYRSACIACPANMRGQDFGCMGFISYPISGEAEAWLLNRLPQPAQAPLIWLLLKQGVDNFHYSGETIKEWRQQAGVFFEDPVAATRRLGEFRLSADQLFEMIFGVGHSISANHAGILLLLLHVIPNNIEADQIQNISPPPPDADQLHPFLLDEAPYTGNNQSIIEFQNFLKALYIAWRLDVPVLIDA